MKQFNDNSKTSQWFFVALIVAVAISVRVFALISFTDSLYGDFPVLDEKVYHDWAVNLISDDSGGYNISDFAPLPAYIMAAVYKVFSPNMLYIRIMNMIFGVLTCLLVFAIGKRLAGPVVGALSGLVIALYKPHIFFSIVLHKTALSVFLFAAVVYTSLIWMDKLPTRERRPGKGTLLAGLPVGFFLGMLINVRSNCVVLAPVLIIWAVWVYLRRKTAFSVLGGAVVFFIVGFVAAALPFSVNNYRSTGKISVTPAGGFNLYIANNPDNPLPYYRPVSFSLSSPKFQAIGFVIEASRREQRRLTTQEASSFWVREVARNAMDRPAAFTRKTGLKVLAALNRYESADNHHLGFLKDHIGFLRVPFFSLWLILPFGMAGLTMLFFNSNKASLAGLLFLSYMLTMVIFFCNVRIRLPVVVILIPFSVMGLAFLVDAIKTKKTKKIISYFVLCTLFFCLAFFPIPGRTDTTAYLNIHATNLAFKGMEKEAFSLWERSAAMRQSYSAYANLSMADRYLDRGDTAGALSRIDRIPDDSLAAAIKYHRLGDVMLKRGNTQEAVDAYKKSLEINSSQLQVHVKLLRIYEQTDKNLADRQYRIFQYISSFYSLVR